MITNFKNHRNPKTTLTWDDFYPKSYVYKKSKKIKELGDKLAEIQLAKER